jgi:hypothetical protein
MEQQKTTTALTPAQQNIVTFKSKVNGSYAGPDGQADYSDWHAQHQ